MAKIKASGNASALSHNDNDVLFTFSVVETFGVIRKDVFDSNGQPHEDRYLKGMRYHVRKNNIRLQELAFDWLKQGKIRRV